MTGISSAWQEKNRLEGMQKDREIQKLALRQLYLKCPIKSFCYYTHIMIIGHGFLHHKHILFMFLKLNICKWNRKRTKDQRQQHFSHWSVKRRQSWHIQCTWPPLHNSANPLGSDIRPTRWQAGGSANGNKLESQLKPFTLHLGFFCSSSSSGFGAWWCPDKHLTVDNMCRKPGQPAMKVTR